MQYPIRNLKANSHTKLIILTVAMQINITQSVGTSIPAVLCFLFSQCRGAK